MSSGFFSAHCFRVADPGACGYSKTFRFGISSRGSGAKLANPKLARLIVCFGSSSGSCGQTGRRVCFSSNPNRPSLGIGWVFVCSGVGDPVPTAADPPQIANSSTSFGKCGPAIPLGGLPTLSSRAGQTRNCSIRFHHSQVSPLNPTRRPNLEDLPPQPRQGLHRRRFLCRPDRHLHLLQPPPRYLLQDRDSIYGLEFAHRATALALEQKVGAARSPWQNPFIERLIGSVRRE